MWEIQKCGYFLFSHFSFYLLVVLLSVTTGEHRKKMENKIAPYMYRSLKGVFCVYKPSGMHMKVLQETFTAALSKGKLIIIIIISIINSYFQQ